MRLFSVSLRSISLATSQDFNFAIDQIFGHKPGRDAIHICNNNQYLLSRPITYAAIALIYSDILEIAAVKSNRPSI